MFKKNMGILFTFGLVVFTACAMTPDADKITFKPVVRADIPLVREWFKNPHVIKWWPAPPVGCDEHGFERFLCKMRDDVFPYVMMLDGRPIGYIQYYLVNPDSEKHAWLPPILTAFSIGQDILGIDVFIGEQECCGKGLGQLCIKKFVDFLLHLPTKINMIIIDPDPANTAAIKCYTKVGFTPIGEFISPDGPALLMVYKSC
jgi:aminoglycoside 6'-N-acetyltransferase